jgi:hypothetical protein
VCGRYTLATPDPATLRARFPVGETVEIRRRFNVAPADDVLAVTTDVRASRGASCSGGDWFHRGPTPPSRA